jgi:hypothetical protein
VSELACVYDRYRDLFLLTVTEQRGVTHSLELSPEQAVDLRVALKRETWRRAEEIGEHGR